MSVENLVFTSYKESVSKARKAVWQSAAGYTTIRDAPWRQINSGIWSPVERCAIPMLRSIRGEVMVMAALGVSSEVKLSALRNLRS